MSRNSRGIKGKEQLVKELRETIKPDTPELVKELIEDKIVDLNHEINNQKTDINTILVGLDTPEFIKRIFENDAILGLISSKVGNNIKSSDIYALLREMPLTVKDYKGNKTQISSDEMNKLLGMPVFEDFEIISGRKRTESEPFTIMYNFQGKRYSIVYKNEDEQCNIFTLYDYFNNKKFRHVDGHLETLATLGVNIISFKGLQSKNGELFGKDYVYIGASKRMEEISPVTCRNRVTYYMYNTQLIKTFFRELERLGYGELMFRYFSHIINKHKREGRNTFFTKLEYAEKPSLGYFEFLKFGKNYIVYDRNVYIKRDVLFHVMKLALLCICKHNEEFNIDDLMKSITFYGGHDFVAQGDDLSNYFITDISHNDTLFVANDTKKQIKKESSSLKIKKEPSDLNKNFERMSKIQGRDKSDRPVEFVFTHKARSFTLNVNELTSEYGTKKRDSDSISPSDVLYFIVKCLNELGYTQEDFIKVGSPLLSDSMFVKEKNTKNGSGVLLSNGLYYCNSKIVGWKNLSSCIRKLFYSLEISLKSLEVKFN